MDSDFLRLKRKADDLWHKGKTKAEQAEALLIEVARLRKESEELLKESQEIYKRINKRKKYKIDISYSKSEPSKEHTLLQPFQKAE